MVEKESKDVASPSVIDACARADAQVAGAEIIAASRLHSLGGLSVRDLIDEGRRGEVSSTDECFGLWGAGEDGVEYQRRVRSEW